MGAEMDGIDDVSLTEVKSAIEKVFSDTTVSQGETIARMEAIVDYCQENIMVLEADMEGD